MVVHGTPYPFQQRQHLPRPAGGFDTTNGHPQTPAAFIGNCAFSIFSTTPSSTCSSSTLPLEGWTLGLRDRPAQASVGNVEGGHRARSDRAALGVCSPVAKGPRGRMYTAVQRWTPEVAERYQSEPLLKQRRGFCRTHFGRRLWIGFGELFQGSCLTLVKIKVSAYGIGFLLAFFQSHSMFPLDRGPPRRQAKPDPQGSCVTITDFVKIF